MTPEHERELWEIRFQRILELEEEGFGFYRRLLEEKAPLLKEMGIEPVLRQIMHDEARHIHIAKDLVKLVRKKSEEG